MHSEVVAVILLWMYSPDSRSGEDVHNNTSCATLLCDPIPRTSDVL